MTKETFGIAVEKAIVRDMDKSVAGCDDPGARGGLY
jgi:hypothetical protein